jgi:hypothetical protein
MLIIIPKGGTTGQWHVTSSTDVVDYIRANAFLHKNDTLVYTLNT